MNVRKIAFVLGDWLVGSPGQQLLDRFLIGFPLDGEFHKPSAMHVTAWCEVATAAVESALTLREREWNLRRASQLAEAVSDADAILVVPRAGAVAVSEQILSDVLTRASKGSRCFIYGCLPGGTGAERFGALAERRGVSLFTGTSISTAFRLPELEVMEGEALQEALIVVQGRQPAAELAGMDGLMPLIGRRAGGEKGIWKVTGFTGRQVWQAGEAGMFSKDLLAAAISRSNTAQGAALRDGRTQDLFGKGLLQKLAVHPRAWLIEHRDGFRSTVVVLDGVVADCNFAFQRADGTVRSAQLYRPPAPNRCEFDRLAAAIEAFFHGGKAGRPEWSLAIAYFVGEVAT